MIRSRSNSLPRGGLILILLILALHFFRVPLGSSQRESLSPLCSDVFIQIEGDVLYPGVYGFSRNPGIRELLARAGGMDQYSYQACSSEGSVFSSGSRVEIKNKAGTPCLVEKDMSAFYRITLGIPVSLNGESAQGLTAIKGIGPKTAAAIVREREERGGFKRLREIMDVKGIGPVTYRKIRPFLKLRVCRKVGD